VVVHLLGRGGRPRGLIIGEISGATRPIIKGRPSIRTVETQMNEPATLTRKLGVALFVGLLVVTAGCSGLGGGGQGTDAAGTEATPASAATGTDTGAAEQTSDGHDHTGTATNATPVTEESTAGDGHDHSHGGESNATETAASTGKMAVVVAGERVDLSEAFAADAPLRMDDERPDTYHVNESVGLQAALSAAGVEAAASTLRYDGETYRESTTGTELVYRVNGEPVEPAGASVGPGDEVWVLVVTDDSGVETPGDYIPPERLHVHGDINFTVDGERVDFSREKYQQAGHNDHFHFEGGHANPWHAHSAHVTIAYGLSTLEGINVTADTLTYENTTYELGPDAEARLTVNGEPVDPTAYYFKDGDTVRVVVESETETETES
jgi:hypothetical protein